MPYSPCVESVRHTDIPVSEKGRTFRILNPERTTVLKVQVDGCLLIERQCCDYLFDVAKNNTIYYVELKGKNINKAVSQLLSTAQHFKNTHRDRTKVFHVVSSRVPGTTPQKQRLLKSFRAKTGCRLIVKNGSNQVTV